MGGVGPATHGRRATGLICATVALALLAGCGAGNSASTGNAHTAKLTSITVAMGYIPNVQFAPFYVAQARGYYRKAGLDIHLRYGIEPDLLRLASVGKVDFVDSGGDEVLAAGAQGLHVTYVMTQYSRFPSAVFALKSAGIQDVQQLRGKQIGLPGLYGASYVGLLALLQRASIPRSSVTISSIGFTQVESVAHHKVDAAVGYAMNEPIQLRRQGYKVKEIDIYPWANLAGAGIAAGDTLIARHPRVVRAFVQATLRGLRDSLHNPTQAYRISAAAVKIRTGAKTQQAVLRRAIDFWRPEPGHPLGWMDPVIWSRTARLLFQFKQIPHSVSAGMYYTNRFIPGG